MNTAEKIIRECLENNIRVTGVVLVDGDKFGYVVSGFSKSGTVTVYDDGVDDYGEGKAVCLQRYDQKEEINSFRALASIAYRWNESYVNNGFEWDTGWLPVFVKYGWLKPKTVTVYERVKYDGL